MKAYILQIGVDTEGTLRDPAYAEDLHAYSFDEAIEKAKAIAVKRPVRETEKAVHLLDEAADPQLVWSRSMADIREA